MKDLIKGIIKNTGFQIKRYPDYDLARRLLITSNYKIDTLLDIGANAGQYASNMRELGYVKKIISFEPLASAFGQLKRKSKHDNNWILNNYALGDEDGKTIINVSGNSVSSSILNILPMHVQSAPDSKYLAKDDIQIKKLDSIFDLFYNEGDSVMMKIDTQGYEKNVLDGANESLKKIKIIQLEMSVVPLYENEMLINDMINYLDNLGFQLFSLENGFSNATTGQLLQVDGIFVRKDICNID